MNPTKYSKMTFKKIYAEIKKKLNIKKIMNYSDFIEKKMFCQVFTWITLWKTHAR